MIIKNALVFTLDQGFVNKEVKIKDGRFTDEDIVEDTVIDAQGNYLIPGLVDIHFHGCAGHDFSDGTPEALQAIGAYELKNGITSICPASMTLAEETLANVCENAYAYYMKPETDKPEGSRLCGIHLEGPFISMEKKGAQNPAYVKSPDIAMFNRLQDAAHGLVKLITIAPETEGAEEFIKELSSKVHISVGHTCSDYDTAYKAFALGADHVTHFFNAMPAFTHRAPGVFGAAFDQKHVMPEMICDGVHINPSAVRVVFSLFGKERMIMISDSMMATGMEDGDYSLGGLPVKVHGNLATLADGTIAGSATNLMDCVRTVVKKMDIPLETAIRCASYNPAKAIGVDDVCGSIEAGKLGDCVILSKDDLATQKVILGGKVVA